MNTHKFILQVSIIAGIAWWALFELLRRHPYRKNIYTELKPETQRLYYLIGNCGALVLIIVGFILWILQKTH
jgi:uncharacterized membrane protein